MVIFTLIGGFKFKLTKFKNLFKPTEVIYSANGGILTNNLILDRRSAKHLRFNNGH
jgi:hypothetical protein